MVCKPEFCKNCPISHVTEGYVPLKLRPGTSLVVGEAAEQEEIKLGEGFCGGSGSWLKNLFRAAHQSWDNISTLNVIGCKPPENVFPGSPKWYATSKEAAIEGLAHCAMHHLWPGIEKANREKIFAVGNVALRALTGRDGINTWRGSPLPLLGDNSRTRVIPTIHPAALMRQAKLSSVVVKDLGKSLVLPPENYNLFPTLEEVEKFVSRSFAFDLEWDSSGCVTVCGLCDRFYTALVVPWVEPYLGVLRGIFERATDLVGHNIIQADLPFVERLGWDISRARIHDTMLKQHLCQPDYPHSLAFVASVFTNKVFWKGRWEKEESEDVDNVNGQQWRTWDREFAISRGLGGYGGCHSAGEAFNIYNARDTDAEFQVNTPLSQLLRKYTLDDVYNYVSIPTAYLCRDMASRGLRLDTSRLGEVRKELNEEIKILEGKLPDGLRPYTHSVSCNRVAPPNCYRAKVKVCKGAKKAPHEPVELTFIHPSQEKKCSSCTKPFLAGKLAIAKIVKGTREEIVNPYNSPKMIQEYVKALELKEVFDRKTKKVTTGKKARRVWAKSHPEFTLLGGLKGKITLRNNFAKDSLLNEERMYFNLKVHGTAEGRLSSTGQREGVDLNIQNQPSQFKIIYTPDKKEFGFLSLDIVQGENMLTTWFAKDWPRWERLQQPGYNEHADLATRIFNLPVAKGDPATKPFYDVGKIFNHSKNYGAGVRKQTEILAEHGYDHYTTEDLKDFNAIWEEMNKGTSLWQKEVIGLATQQGYLRNPFGRVRWFSSRDLGSKALAFLPASTLADMVLRMMIAHHPEEPHCAAALDKLGMATYMPLVEGWYLSIQVHDELVFQGPWKDHLEQASRSTMIMSQPWKELEGFRFGVDLKGSQKSWGECKKIKL
jgi:uracil-DNA glycosylase family 4